MKPFIRDMGIIAALTLALAAIALCGCGPPPLVLPSVPVPIPVPPPGDPPRSRPPEQLQGALARLEGLLRVCWSIRLDWHHENGWTATTQRDVGEVSSESKWAEADTLLEALKAVAP